MYEHLYPTALKIKNAYSSADAVIWLSQVACNLYNIQNSNGVYLPNPAELKNSIKPKNMFNKKLLTVGRFDDEIKRIDRILLIFKEVLKRNPGYHLDVVGSCPMDFVLRDQGGKTIGEFLESRSIPSENIKFWGDQDNVSKYYQKADILIMPSKCEGFGMVLVEALSSGLPCACSDYLGIEEIIQSNYNGWTSGDDIYLANKIIEAGADLNVYKTMSKNALESVKKYDLNEFCMKWSYLVECLTEKNGVQDYQNNIPIDKLSKITYEKIILEYECLLNDVADSYVHKELPQVSIVPVTPGMTFMIKFDDWVRRFKLSIKRHGIRHTTKKLANKVYKKLVSLKNR
jgi:glycosyltransferase involved in cell wall biosynthesis